MSNLVYVGTGGGSNISTTATTGGGIGSVGNYFRDAQARQQREQAKNTFYANKYDHSNTNTYTVSDILSGDINAANPYTKEVILGGTDTQVATGSVFRRTPNGGGFWVTTYKHVYTYNIGLNQGYVDFEQTVFDAQKQDYQKKLDAYEVNQDKIYSKDKSNLTAGHSNGLYGAGTLGIDALSTNIVDLQKQIDTLAYEDAHTSDYNRIQNTDNSKEISALEAQRDAFKAQYDSAVSDYNTRYAIAKAAQDYASASNWKISPTYIIPPEAPLDLSQFLKPTVRQDVNGFANLLLSGDINSWMAGGSLYDAPRAGDVMFNVMGNMNTVRFLGIEDTNNIPDMVKEFANPEVYRTLGNMAGDNNFSVIPPTLYS